MLFQNLLSDTIDALTNIGIHTSQINRIELLGDVTRTPIFQDTIVSAFNLGSTAELKRTMHSTDSVSLGLVYS